MSISTKSICALKDPALACQEMYGRFIDGQLEIHNRFTEREVKVRLQIYVLSHRASLVRMFRENHDKEKYRSQ